MGLYTFMTPPEVLKTTYSHATVLSRALIALFQCLSVCPGGVSGSVRRPASAAPGVRAGRARHCNVFA